VLDLRKVRALPERVLGGLSYHRGPVLANRFGYQVFRAMYRHVDWRLRLRPSAPEVRSYVEALDRDGCITIPDFLGIEEFRAVRAEYDKSRLEVPYEAPLIEDNGVVEERVAIGAYREHFPRTWSALFENATLRAIVGGAIRRSIDLPPRGWAMRWHTSETPVEAKGGDHVRGANYVHADMHYPTIKAFYYLSDTDESNGAYQFAFGSHRMTPARLAYEYDASIRVAASRKDGTYATIAYSILRAPSADQEKAMGITCTSVGGKANTLVVTNTQGFHRQGRFGANAVREALLLCFRTSEPGGVSLLP
jgi:hypothetical protein